MASFCKLPLIYYNNSKSLRIEKKKPKSSTIMNFEIVFQLASLAFIVAAGPLVIVLLASQGDGATNL